MRCAIWYHMYNLKNVKNIHGGMLILVKLQAEACNFTKINTPPWVFFTAQRTTYMKRFFLDICCIDSPVICFKKEAQFSKPTFIFKRF